MVLLRFLEAAGIALFVAFLFTQIIVPLIRHKPLFALFRKAPEEVELKLANPPAVEQPHEENK